MKLRALWLLVGPLLMSLLVLATAPGCDDGGDGDADSDADQDSDQDDDWDLDIEPPAPPELPAPPVLTPCPAGWREVPPEDPSDPYDVATCDPWAEGGMQECEGDQAHFPGEPGCRRIGSQCPDGEWPDDLPGSGVVYVRAGAPSGGAGTRASPFGTIAEATAAATDGTIIALSAGTFDEAVVLLGGVTIQGACVARTVVAWSGAGDIGATVRVRSTGASLRDLTIGGEGQGIVVEGEGATLDVQGMLVPGVRRAGLVVLDHGVLTGEDLIVRGTRGMREPDPGIPEIPVTHGYGLWVRGGGRAELERVVVESNHCAGAVAEDSGSVLRLSDAAIVGTRGQELDGVFGYGLATWLKASVELRRVAVERNHMYGMLVVEEGTSATLTDVVLRETEAQENDGTRGQGLYVVWGATAQARRVLLERNRLFGVAVESAGTSVTLDDLVVRDTRVQEADGWGGVGLAAYDSAQVELGRALVAGNRMAGLQCLDAGTLCRAHDLVVRDTTGILGGRGGNGLQVVGGARAELARSVFERNRTASLVVTDERSSLGFEDGVVRDTRPQEADNSGGHGLIANVGASVDLTRCLFQRNRSCEILADGTGTTLAATDIVVRDARSNASDGEHGRCLDVQYGARAKVLRAKLSRCRNIAVAAFNPGSSVVMSDVEVLDTLESECAIGSCAGVGVGTGVGSYAGAKVEVTRFIVSGSVLAGVQLAYGSERLPDGERRYYPDAGTIDLHEGEISHNLVGAHIEGEGFDIYRLMDRVIYRDNGRNLDTNELPVPDMALPPEW